ncbi:MAG: CAP domain-containing protein [Betaproteobacteria bacterium]
MLRAVPPVAGIHGLATVRAPIASLRLLFALALAFGCDAEASDLYGAINRLRAGEGGCSIAARLPPLKRQDALERAARDLAQGDDLKASLKSSGYRGSRAVTFRFRGEGVGDRAPALLANESNCPKLQDAAMTDVGVYQDAGQVWIVLAQPFAPAVRMSARAASQRVLDLVNQARARPRNCGDKAFDAAAPLRLNDLLAAASREHAEDMAQNNYFSHRARDGSGPAQRVERAGYQWRITAENIAAGQSQPEEAVAGWVKSPAHCADLMNPAFTEMGVAFAVERGSELGVYWSQTFGAPR